MRLPYREWGSGDLLYLENALVEQIAKWKTHAEHVCGYFGHQVRFRPYGVRNIEGKKVASDPTLTLGKCARCKGQLIICSDIKQGVRWFGINRRCRLDDTAPDWRVRGVDRRVVEMLNVICKNRGNRPLVPRDNQGKDVQSFIIRNLDNRLMLPKTARRFRLPELHP